MKSFFQVILWTLVLASQSAGAEARVSSVAIPGPVVRLSEVDGNFFVLQGEPPNQTIYVIDATDPASARIARAIPVEGTLVEFVANPQHLFLAMLDDEAALRIVDWKTGMTISRYRAPSGRGATQLALGGPFWKTVSPLTDPYGPIHLSTTNNEGTQTLFVLDVLDPAAPKLVLQQELPASAARESPSNTPDEPTAKAINTPSQKPIAQLQPPNDDALKRFAQPLPSDVVPSTVMALARSSKDPRITALLTNRPQTELILVQDLEHRLTFDDINGDGVLRLSCLGDSNTSIDLRRFPVSWCTAIAYFIWNPRFQTWNHSVIGATLIPGARISPAPEQLETALSRGADAVVLAFGTNDLFAGDSPERIVTAYLKLVEQAEKSGLTVYVATTPPTNQKGAAGAAQVTPLNSLIEETFPSAQVIDFHSGFSAAHFLDGLHVTPVGQMLRAERAALRLIATPASHNESQADERPDTPGDSGNHPIGSDVLSD